MVTACESCFHYTGSGRGHCLLPGRGEAPEQCHDGFCGGYKERTSHGAGGNPLLGTTEILTSIERIAGWN